MDYYATKETLEKFFVKTKLTNPDKMSIKSLLVLPEPVVFYSRIDLPGSNILERSQLSHVSLNYFQLLNQKREINTFG